MYFVIYMVHPTRVILRPQCFLYGRSNIYNFMPFTEHAIIINIQNKSIIIVTFYHKLSGLLNMNTGFNFKIRPVITTLGMKHVFVF